MDLKKLQKIDPLKRSAKKQTEAPEFSPMSPPDAYAPPNMEAVPYEALPMVLRRLTDEHEAFCEPLKSFEDTLTQLQEDGLTPNKDVDEGLRNFFTFFDDHIVVHQLAEDKILFPTLHERLLEKGEHGAGQPPRTAVDMLEDDHAKVMQLAAVTFNFLALAARLPDPASRAVVLDAGLEQGKALIEMLRLHMFREDNVVFALAARHLDESTFNDMEKRFLQLRG